jgi:hypothetical protein
MVSVPGVLTRASGIPILPGMAISTMTGMETTMKSGMMMKLPGMKQHQEKEFVSPGYPTRTNITIMNAIMSGSVMIIMMRTITHPSLHGLIVGMLTIAGLLTAGGLNPIVRMNLKLNASEEVSRSNVNTAAGRNIFLPTTVVYLWTDLAIPFVYWIMTLFDGIVTMVGLPGYFTGGMDSSNKGIADNS